MTQESCEMRMERESLMCREIVKRENRKVQRILQIEKKKGVKSSLSHQRRNALSVCCAIDHIAQST